MISIRSVTRMFGRVRAVNEVSLEIQAGDSVALWGTNGAGKTTLIRCVLGLLGFGGSITLGGYDVHRRGKESRMLVGYVPQELGFYDDLGVGESVRFFGRLKGLHVPRPAEVLAMVGLEASERKRIRELSGGMKQRLALAMALLGDPPVLVLDEVTASLDVCGRDEFISLLSRLSGKGRTMLFASHRIDEVATLARRVAVMEQGRLVHLCSSADFAARTGSSMVLHLMMPGHVRADAINRLRAGGLQPQLNGVGILVPVVPEQKAAPFRLLADARIAIDDFEIISASVAATHVHHSEAP